MLFKYKCFLQILLVFFCSSIGALTMQPSILPGVAGMGILVVFLNYSIFNPNFTYTNESNDIGEVIAGGAVCAIIPATIYGLIFWGIINIFYGVGAFAIFIAATIIIHGTWYKIICRPGGPF
jgi:hypothetical protein